eukprot:Skav223488  [mRNA]  locus=scaffold643:103153:113955:+ [translate_table: standard]
MAPRADLFAPSSYAILKLYVHYEAWEAPYQFPLPLEGRYWDGDFRCDGEDKERPCRGLQRSKFVRPLGDDVRVFLADEAASSCRGRVKLVIAASAASPPGVTTIIPWTSMDHRSPSGSW